MTPIFLDYFLKREDFSHAVRAFQKKTYEKASWLMAAAYLIITWMNATLTLRMDGNLQMTLLTIFLPLFFVFFVYRLSTIGEEQLKDSIQWRFDENAIVIKNGLAETRFDWQFFGTLMESDQDYFLVVKSNKNLFKFIPKRVFPDAHTESSFREFLTQKLGSVQSAAVSGWFYISLALIGLLFIINIGLLFYTNYQGI